MPGSLLAGDAPRWPELEGRKDDKSRYTSEEGHEIYVSNLPMPCSLVGDRVMQFEKRPLCLTPTVHDGRGRGFPAFEHLAAPSSSQLLRGRGTRGLKVSHCAFRGSSDATLTTHEGNPRLISMPFHRDFPLEFRVDGIFCASMSARMASGDAKHRSLSPMVNCKWWMTGKVERQAGNPSKHRDSGSYWSCSSSPDRSCVRLGYEANLRHIIPQSGLEWR